ncbi:single-stranded-DNA-specific exonuclease RecJ [Hydromonas duriensis]|uniref:Single-stranded-DNA-specific exonuclease RecJ n=1 Tax=Hydromonas duriensis TaxID=1527608 RepID=A0A4R6Y8Y1_9BURK|nr:single-stranded-DNA-specific exonuclease RecJ [Hydromonas duriensis]TDR31886.1 exonuclease RecJ [Hydromonas duriensis]
MTTINQRQPNPHIAAELESAGHSALLARLLAARGVNGAQEAQLELNQLISPASLLGIDVAAHELANAIEQSKHLLIIADYDCDGATACAVGLRGLRSLGAHVDFLVPNRFEYGYGLSPEIVTLAANHPDFDKPDLLLTVDNGMASIEGVAHANALGMPVLITDHHLPADETPSAIAIVNPNQHGCPFPSKNLAGVGVMFYVLVATRAELKNRGYFTHRPMPNLAELLDLVALGTVADVVKLDHNNRILVANGLARMRAGKMCAGINALLNVAGRDFRKASSFDMGFAIGPRLNAAGRLDDMSLGIRCLTTDDEQEALQLAQQLDEMNRERRAIEQQMREEAEVNLSSLDVEVQFSICLTHEEFHQGVIGIVAGRLKEKYHRPTIVFAPDGKEFLKGSGRSINGIHLRDVLDWVNKNAPETIVKFGGHAMAAGLTIVRADFELFKDTFEQAVVAMSEPEVFTKQIVTDGQLHSTDFSIANVDAINKQVWGQGFAAPLFEDRFEVIEQRVLKDTHLKLVLKNQNGTFNAIWFFHAEEMPKHIQCVYQLQRNDWNGKTDLQFLIEYAVPID